MTGTICIYRQYLCVRALIDHISDGPGRLSILPQQVFIYLPICVEGSESDYRARQRSYNPADTAGDGDIGKKVQSFNEIRDMRESSWYPADGPYHTAYWRVKGNPLQVQDGSGSMVKEFVPVPCPKVRKGLETRWNDMSNRWEKLLKSGWVDA